MSLNEEIFLLHQTAVAKMSVELADLCIKYNLTYEQFILTSRLGCKEFMQKYKDLERKESK